MILPQKVFKALKLSIKILQNHESTQMFSFLMLLEPEPRILGLDTVLPDWVWLLADRWGFSGGASHKEPTSLCRRCKRCGFNPCVRKISWKRAWQPIPICLPGESHDQRNPMGYDPQGLKESDTTEVNCRLWVIMTCQDRLINCNKQLLWWDVGMREARILGEQRIYKKISTFLWT